ncbi:MAG: YceI family protein [Candidatus Didemnitutus sp.]|nr:YceI family protein [Candidatus Didemnitutus sp.]
MNTSVRLLVIAASALISASVAHAEKLVTQNAQISFFSTTPAEDIKSVNNSVVSSLDTATGEVAYSVPMQSFEFEKALMQKHFNQEKFLNTKVHPRATFKGKITNLADIDFTKDGTYPATIVGVLNIKGADKDVSETGTLTIKGGAITAEAKFSLTLADFGVTFVEGKPSKNIAKIVEVTVKAPYAAAAQ